MACGRRGRILRKTARILQGSKGRKLEGPKPKEKWPLLNFNLNTALRDKKNVSINMLTADGVLKRVSTGCREEHSDKK